MPALSPKTLLSKLRPGLPPGSIVPDTDDVRPLLVVLPEQGTVHIYLWTLTQDQSRTGRPPGEFKIQLILPGQSPGQRGSLASSTRPSFLLGFSPDYGVFAGWEASLYTDFAYSSNVQAREELLIDARDNGWAVAPPRRLAHGGQEVRVAFAPSQLPLFLKTSLSADNQGLSGEQREAFFLSRAPRVETDAIPDDLDQLADYIQRTRTKITTTRLLRDPAFTTGVRQEFGDACAVCTLQLGIIEAAHIIPASEVDGSDEIWNGIALCPNHHRIFDSRLFVIDQGLVLRVDYERVDFLKENRLDCGIEHVTAFADQTVLPPNFWEKNSDWTARMQRALTWVSEKAGMVKSPNPHLEQK